MYKFAIIGTGRIAHVHAEAIKKIKNAKLRAVFDSSIERAKKFSDIYGIHPYNSLDEMFKIENIDIVTIASQNYLHIKQATLSANNNKHIIVEKPFGNSLKEAEKLVKICKQKNLKLSIISQRRWDTSINLLKNLIDHNQLGEIKQANLSLKFARSQQYYDSSGGWRKSKEFSGGGVLINLGTHLIDLALWLFGKPVSVYAETKILAHNIPVEDYALVKLKFKNNIITNICVTTAVRSNSPDLIEVYGTKGYVSIKGRKFSTSLYHKKNLIVRFIQRLYNFYKFKYGSHEQQIRNVINAIKFNKKPLVDGEDGLNALKIIESAYKSAKLKKEMKIKWN